MEKEDVIKAVNDTLAEFKKNLGNIASEKDLNDLRETLKGLEGQAKDAGVKTGELQKGIDELKAAAEAQGLVLAKIKDQAQEVRGNPIRKALEDNRDALKAFTSDSNAKSLTIKAAPNHLIGNITSDNNGMFLPGIGQVQRRVPMIRSLLNNNPVGPNNHGIIYYTDQLAVVSGASAKAEGSAPATTSILTWQGYSAPLEEVKDKVRISRKAMDDIDFVESELRNFVNVNLNLAIESLLYDGNGVTPNIYGIKTRGTAYTAAGAGDNGKVVSPNILDLLAGMKKSATKDTAFMPGFALLSHEDYTSLRWLKDDLGQYMISPFLNGPINVHGMQVLPSSLVTSDTALIGDGAFCNVYSKGLTLTLGYDGNDFSEGMVTLLGVEEMAMILKVVHAKAVQYVASIAAEILAMTKPA